MKPIPNKHDQLRMRGIRTVKMVTVIEGDGVAGDPCGEVGYIYDEDGEYIGYVERDAFTHEYLGDR